MARRKGGKSGWFGDHRRHVLAGKGVSTVLPDGRRLDVSRFVAGGEYELSQDELEKRSTDFLISKSRWLYKTILALKSERDVWSKKSVVKYIKKLNMVNDILSERNVEVDYSDIENGE